MPCFLQGTPVNHAYSISGEAVRRSELLEQQLVRTYMCRVYPASENTEVARTGLKQDSENPAAGSPSLTFMACVHI